MNLSNRLSSGLFGTALICALAAAPAVAADDVASKAGVCSACHGGNGTPINTATPIIWGQQSNYLYKELHDYHSGARANATMAPIAQGVALPDLRQLADYFAAKTWPTKTWPAAPPLPPRRRLTPSPARSKCAKPAISRISKAARRRRGSPA